MGYRVYICGPSDCPNDERYVHEGYFGCVPKNFSFTTGRARGHRQHLVDVPGYGKRWRWDGGCDAAGVIPPDWKPDGAPSPDAIVLEME